jgi:hypothetical protein
MLDPEVRPLYEAAAYAKNTSVFGLIVADFLNKPIHVTFS